MSEPFSIFELRRQGAARGRRGHRWRIAAVVVAALFLLFNVFIFFFAPGIVRRQLERRLAAALHRPVAIRKIGLNPYTLSATADGVVIKDRDGRLLFGCDRLYINFDSWSFFSGKWIFQEISLDAPSARLEIDRSGALNISDLLAPPAGPPGRSPSKPPAKPRPLVVRQLTITQARLAFADHSRTQEFATELGPLSLSLKNFSTAPAAPGAPYEFAATTEFGETLRWRGTFSARPLRSSGEFALGQIAIGKYAPYYAADLRGEVLAGKLDATGRYQIDLGAEPRVLKLAGGELHLHDLQIASRGTTAPVVRLPAVDLTGLDASLAPLKFSAAKLAVTGGTVGAQRAADGTINLIALFRPPGRSGATPTAPAAGAAAGGHRSPPTANVSLADLEIRGLGLTLDDATTPRPAHIAIQPLELSVQHLSLASGAPPAPYKLALRFAPQGSFRLDGTIALAPRRAEGAADLADFPAATIGPYLDRFLDLRVTQGTISAQGRIAAAAPAGAKPQISFRGDAELDRVATVDGAAGEDLASFASLGFKQLDFASEPFALSIAQVSLIEPSVHFTIHRDGSSNLAAVLRKKSSPPAKKVTAAPPAASSAPPRQIAIGRVALSDGALLIDDRSVEPNVRLSLSQIAGLVVDLSSARSASGRMDLRAKLDNSAPAVAQGQVNPLAQETFADFTSSLDGADLQPAAPYFAKYVGYQLARGSLTLELNVRVEKEHLDSQNVITLDQLELGAKTDSPSAVKLPVLFAISLLKDNQGKIVIHLPVGGSLKDPNFDVSQVAAQVITNLLTKAATAPFALIGSIFGGSNPPPQLDRIEFASGASALAEAETKKLDVIVRALQGRPGLNLTLVGAADRASDTAVLQRQKLTQFIRNKIWQSRREADPSLTSPDQMKITPEEVNRTLIQLYVATFRPLPTEPLPGAVPPGPPPQTSATAREAAAAESASATHHTLLGRIIRYIFGGTKTTGPSAPTGKATAASAANVPPPEPAFKLPPPAEMEAQLAAELPVEDSDLQQLAAARAQHVKDYLVAQGVADNRVSVGAETGVPGRRVTLQLK